MWSLIVTSIVLGIGLAMDACAVSMTNGLNEPRMKAGKAILIAFMFGLFQALMPLIGWTCVSLVVDKFEVVAKYVPYIAFVLLAIIGGKMLFDGFKSIKKSKASTEVTSGKENEEPAQAVKKLTFAALLLQAIATSIDALSTGFSLADIAGTNFWRALLCAGLIALVTFGISLGAVFIGKKFGDKLGDKAQILGGFVLIAIGLEILIKSFIA